MTLADRICVLRDGVVEQWVRRLNSMRARIRFSSCRLHRLAEDEFPRWALFDELGAHTIGIRAEHLSIEQEGRWRGSVVHSEMLGSDSYVYVDIGTSEPIVVRQEGTATLKPGENVALSPVEHELHRFDRDGRAIAAA